MNSLAFQFNYLLRLPLSCGASDRTVAWATMQTSTNILCGRGVLENWNFFELCMATKYQEKKDIQRRDEKKKKKTTATIENCMHIFCETLNDIHSSPTIDKYRAFFFVCPRKHWCRSRSKAFKYFPNDRTERHTHTGFAPKCASAIVAKLKRNAVQIKSTKTQMGKKTPSTQKNRNRTPQSNHKTIPFECFDAIRFNTQPQTRNGICSAGFWYVCASIRQY